MKRIVPYLIVVIFFGGAFSSCNETPVIEVETQKNDPYKENMINANKYIEQSENTQIESYLSRRGWNMKQLHNGSYIEEYQMGNGAAIDYEDTIAITYTVSALNGSVFYNNVEETVVIGKHQPNVGLDCALQSLHRGSSARVILPSSLAYGVLGDNDRIPSRAVLVYDLKINK